MIFAPILAPLTYLASNSTQPLGLQHLWFIYYLLIISAVYYLLTLLKPLDWFSNLQAKLGVWISDPRILWLVPLAVSGIPGILDETAVIRTSETLIPDPSLLAFYGIFFTLGVFLFRAGALGLDALCRRAPVLLILGLVAAQVAFGWGVNEAVGWTNQLSALFASFYLSLGVIGIFVRLVKQENRFWNYLRGTSYWVYLAHLPMVFGLLILAGALQLPSVIAVPSTFLLALGLSLLTYEVIVRRTPLSKIL